MPDRDDPKSQFKCCVNKGLGQEKAEGSLQFLFILSYDLVGVEEGCLTLILCGVQWCFRSLTYIIIIYIWFMGRDATSNSSKTKLKMGEWKAKKNKFVTSKDSFPFLG